MAGKAGGQDDDVIVDINVTPLVDVVLVLLIIFMVTARLMVPPAIPVELPKASTGEGGEPSSLAITITRADKALPERYYINGTEVTPPALRERVSSELKKKGSKKLQVVIAADQLVPHGKVMWLLDTLRQLGVEQYAFNINPSAP
ncbi:biopolymer transporter ExbD [Myxococcota bacterium]|nr:biopolymer transporter ExbD [Myxococcota bacterium]